MYRKVRFKFFIPALAFAILSFIFFYFSPFSGKAFLIGLVSSIYLIVLSLILNDRSIAELSESILFLSHRFIYSLSFLMFVFVLFTLVADRLFSLFKLFRIGYSPKYSFIILLTICIGGYTCLAYIVWLMSTKQPSGISYKTFLTENAFIISAVFVIIISIFFVIFLLLFPLILNIIPGPSFRRAAYALIILIVLINSDFSKVTFKPSPNLKPKHHDNKLCLIGIDAADWKVIRPLLKKDKLPNLKKILENAAYGYLDCFGKRLSPILWTSFVTGGTSDVHGITGFVFHEKGKKESSLFKSYHRKVPALWHILSASGKRVGVLNWLLSFPAEKVNGYMISRLSPQTYEGLAYPENIYPEIAPLIRTLESTDNITSEERHLQEITLELESLEKTTAHLLEKYEQDAFIFYTQTTDKIMHKFWHCKEPGRFAHEEWDIDNKKINKFGSAIDDHWCKLDGLIGRILEKSDKNTNIVVISDHGAKARSQPFFYTDGNKLLETLGLLKLKNNSDEIDFSQTKLYLNDPTIWNTYYAFSLNTKGREKMGIIQQDDFEAEKQRILQLFQNLRTKKGKRLFGSVYAVDENGTDIIAEHTSLLRKITDEVLIVDEEEIPLKRLLTRVESDSGNHDPRGTIILSGPAFENKIISAYMIEYAISFVLAYMQGYSKKKTIHFFFELMKRLRFIDPYNTLDVMPTLLHVMRLPSAEYMPGHIMTSSLSKDFKKKLNFRRINKYDIPFLQTASDKMKDKEDEKIKDQLRGLGYLG